VSGRYEQVQAETRAQWRDWLARHHATSPGIWLATWKKASGRPHLAHDLVEEALAFGWVDSQPKTVDGQRSARLLTPRKPGSNWSRLNKQRVERLLAAGLMQPAGLAAVAAAQPVWENRCYDPGSPCALRRRAGRRRRMVRLRPAAPGRRGGGGRSDGGSRSC
jgi:uncharacterized protein YdeI (YjbR/CyaY-like superfamily)